MTNTAAITATPVTARLRFVWTLSCDRASESRSDDAFATRRCGYSVDESLKALIRYVAFPADQIRPSACV